MTDPTRGVSQVPDGAREALAEILSVKLTYSVFESASDDELAGVLLRALSAAGYAVVKAETEYGFRYHGYDAIHWCGLASARDLLAGGAPVTVLQRQVGPWEPAGDSP